MNRRDTTVDIGEGRTLLVQVDTGREPVFGTSVTIDPPAAGPIVLFHHPTWDVETAVQCTTLRWNWRSGGVEVEGRLLNRWSGFRPKVTANGEPVVKILHLRRVTDVIPPPV